MIGLHPWFRAVLYGLGGGLITAVLIGVPTAVIPNPFFERIVPTTPSNVFFLVTTSVLIGMLSATYAFPTACRLQEKRLTTGGVLSFFAVGCPVCNKIVLLLLGASGAVSFFEPIQPVLGLVAIALLLWAIWNRFQGIQKAIGHRYALDPDPLLRQ